MLCNLGCLAVVHVEVALALRDEWNGAVGGDESTSSSASYAICGHLRKDIHYILLLCVQLAANLVEKKLYVLR